MMLNIQQCVRRSHTAKTIPRIQTAPPLENTDIASGAYSLSISSTTCQPCFKPGRPTGQRKDGGLHSPIVAAPSLCCCRPAHLWWPQDPVLSSLPPNCGMAGSLGTKSCLFPWKQLPVLSLPPVSLFPRRADPTGQDLRSLPTNFWTIISCRCPCLKEGAALYVEICPCSYVPRSEVKEVSLPCHFPPGSVFNSLSRSMMFP